MTGCITQDDRRTFAPHHRRARAPHDKGQGWRGVSWKETVTWHQPPRDTKTTQYWVLATSDRWRSISRKWYQQSTVNHSKVSANYPVLKLTEHASWSVANGLHVPPIAYKLRFLSHLPGLYCKWLVHQRKEYSYRILSVRSRIVRSLVQSKH